MAYRALYREWRPKTFSMMVGQKPIIDTLRNQVVSGRIAHAYLFCGSRGTGKTSTAKILAKAINCEHPENGDPCGKCANCLRMEHEESLDIIEIDAASNNGVDEMRDPRDTVKYPPQFGRYKVYIIDEVHMLSTSAFNALLKTLEEPPEHIVFILATTEPQKLPETILSRCQRYDFGRISVGEIQKRLKEAADGAGASVSDGALMLIARAAEGGMRDALSILDMCLGYSTSVDEAMVRGILGTCDRSFLFRYTGALASSDAGTVLRMIDELMRDGRDPSVFSRDISNHIRALLLALSAPDEIASILDLTEEDAGEYRTHAEAFTVSRLMKMLDLHMALETEMRFSSSPRLALENTALKCCLRTAETDPQALNDRIAELEKKIGQMEERIAAGAAAAPSAKERASAAPAAAPAKKAAEKPAPAFSAGADAQAVWNEALLRLKKTDPGTWSMLMLGRLARAEGGRYCWAAENGENGGSSFVLPLNRDEKRKKIGALLSELTGAECTFEALSGPEETSDVPDSDREYVNGLYQTFGREPVDVVDSI